ncbi:hypothetical protein HK102_009103, partial [Quaeritorhiza haematococci]
MYTSLSAALLLIASLCVYIHISDASSFSSSRRPVRRQEQDASKFRMCGTREFSLKDVASERRIAEASPDDDFNIAFPVTVDVVFHVLNAGDDIESGNVSQSDIEAQINVLNQDYGPTGVFNFRLKEVTRTNNPKWFAGIRPAGFVQNEMKKALRKGDAKTLNIYAALLPNGLLGYATFPTDYESRPWDDGVVVLYSTLPNGAMEPFNLGRTLTHEVGHWFGLWHTFQNGCSYPNDFVTDTPPQIMPSSGCPLGRKSCNITDFSVPAHQ